jgi:hypothetical protein
MIARRRATSMSHTAGCMRRSRRCCALALLALVCATTFVLAAAKGCACPRKGDDLDAWLQCIGFDEEERERLMSEGWQAEDLVEMPLDDAESALRISRAKAWRIARCNGKEDARGRPSHSDLQLATYPEPDGEIWEQHAALEDDGGQFSAAESRHHCKINLYGGLYFPNFYYSLVADMPAYCGCTFQMRKYPSSADEDIPPHSVLVVGNEMDEMELLDAAVMPVLRILLRMLEKKSPALATMGLFYFGDELMHFPMHHNLHSELAWVYHQMWRPDLRHGISPHFQVWCCAISWQDTCQVWFCLFGGTCRVSSVDGLLFLLEHVGGHSLS